MSEVTMPSSFISELRIYNNYLENFENFRLLSTCDALERVLWTLKNITQFEADPGIVEKMVEHLFSREDLSATKRNELALLAAERFGLHTDYPMAVQDQFRVNLQEFLGSADEIDQLDTANELHQLAIRLFAQNKSDFESNHREVLYQLFFHENAPIDIIRTIMHKVREDQERELSDKGFLLLKERPYSLCKQDIAQRSSGNVRLIYGGSRRMIEAFLQGNASGIHFTDSNPGLNCMNTDYRNISRLAMLQQARTAAVRHFDEPCYLYAVLPYSEAYYGLYRASTHSIFKKSIPFIVEQGIESLGHHFSLPDLEELYFDNPHLLARITNLFYEDSNSDLPEVEQEVWAFR